MNRQIIDSMYDGIIILEKNGTISEMNESAAILLGIDKSYIGKPYAEIMLENNIAENDEFHQTLLDALTEKKIKKTNIPYIKNNGKKSFINISVSKLSVNEGESRFYIVFKDITAEIKERKRRDDNIIAMLIIIGYICVFSFSAALWQYLGKPISQSLYSKLMVLIVLAGCYFLAKYTDLKLSDLGLSLKRKTGAIFFNSVVTLICIVILAFGKMLIQKNFLGYEFYTDGSFIQWNKYPVMEWITYLLSVAGQQIVARSFIYESLAKLIPNDKKEIKTIIFSSLLFGAIHIHLGFIYMIGAVALLFVFGFIYRKQRSVWALCIPHYILGMMVGLLGYVQY